MAQRALIKCEKKGGGANKEWYGIVVPFYFFIRSFISLCEKKVRAQIRNGMVFWYRSFISEHNSNLYSLCEKRVRAQIKNGLVFWYRSFISEHNIYIFYSLCEKRVRAQIKNGLVLWSRFIFLCAIEVI